MFYDETIFLLHLAYVTKAVNELIMQIFIYCVHVIIAPLPGLKKITSIKQINVKQKVVNPEKHFLLCNTCKSTM